LDLRIYSTTIPDLTAVRITATPLGAKYARAQGGSLAAAALLLASSFVPAADSLDCSDALPHRRALLGGSRSGA
jgi:hypothetical protein